MVFLLGGMAGAATIFESVGSSMDGWVAQYHATSNKSATAPVWVSDGTWITGEPFYSVYHDENLGGSMFHTNGFTMAVDDVAVFTMDFQGKGIVSPDHQNHWWLSFGLRTGGEDPWTYGDTAAKAAFTTGGGAGQPNGFVIWNTVSDAWTFPYPHCDIASDANYESDIITITFKVKKTDTGFGPSVITTSNHTTGARSTATSLFDQVNANNSAASNLYFFCELPPIFDEPGGASVIGSSAAIRNMKLTVDKASALTSGEESEVPEMGGTKYFLRSISEIKRLSNAEAGKLYTARITGQVLNLHPDHARIFIHDGVAGMYVELETPASGVEGLRVGCEVRIDGETHAGGYSPVLFASNVEITGWNPLPEAQRLDRALLSSTGFDVDWVEVEGRPVAMEYVESYAHYLISMEVFDTVMEVFVPYSPDGYKKIKPFMYQRVRVPGVIGTTANSRLQMTGRILYINSVDDFTLTPESTGYVPRYLPINELVQYRKDSLGLVKTRGTIVSATPDVLYLRGEEGNLKASVFKEKNLKAGDQVELLGYVIIQPVSPSFRTVSVTRLEKGPLPEPVDILLNGDGIDPDWNYELVRLDAEFVYAEKTFTKRRLDLEDDEYSDITQETLWCRIGTRVFEAKLPEGEASPEKLRPGSMIRLTGICHVSKTKNPRLDQMTESLWLEIPTEASIAIVRQASWWTPRRLLWGLLTALSFCLAILFWANTLRKTVAAQTETIGQQIVRETILNERQRIARELHDTLEQGLTALSFQLRRIYRKINHDPDSGQQAVEMAERMLQVCREESRASIQDLRGGILEEMDLPSAIRQTLASQLDETSMDLKSIDSNLEVEGVPVRLTLFAEHQLLRLVTEAAHNAIQHASPEMILIRLHYNKEQLQVLIQDDGCGFNPDAVSASERFGVLGMYERANRLNGTLDIESEAGKGTRIKLTCPIENFIEEKKL